MANTITKVKKGKIMRIIIIMRNKGGKASKNVRELAAAVVQDEPLGHGASSGEHPPGLRRHLARHKAVVVLSVRRLWCEK